MLEYNDDMKYMARVIETLNAARKQAPDSPYLTVPMPFIKVRMKGRPPADFLNRQRVKDFTQRNIRKLGGYQ